MPPHNNNSVDTMSQEDLSRLLNLINVPPSKQQLPSMNFEAGSSSDGAGDGMPHATLPGSGACQHQSTEAYALEKFSMNYGTTRDFTHTPKAHSFDLIFRALVQQRLRQRLWRERAPPENIQRTLGVLRILMRDEKFQRLFVELEGVPELVEALNGPASQQSHRDESIIMDILKEITNIFQKLLTNKDLRDRIANYNIHETLVLLLAQNISDVMILRCTFSALTDLAESDQIRAAIAELNVLDHILLVLEKYDTDTRNLAAGLLRVLCEEQTMRENLKVYDGIRVLLSILHTRKNWKLLSKLVWIVVLLGKDQDTREELRALGVMPLLLSLLSGRSSDVGEGSSEGVHGSLAAAAGDSNGSHFSTGSAGKRAASNSGFQQATEEAAETRVDHLALKSGCCAALTELVMCDLNAQQLVQLNGVYTLSQLLLPARGSSPSAASSQEPVTDERETKETEILQINALRTLRFLFSMEKNRRLLRKVFPADIFEKFIDVGHYEKDIGAYVAVVDSINDLSEDKLDEIRENIEATNMSRRPTHHVKGGEYSVLEHIGSGAFGSVYRVEERGSQNHKAMKEVNLNQCTAAKSLKDRENSIGEIISEIKMVQEELRHPNIVRYHKTFTENDKLYIVMELIEGASIGEYCASLREKKERFTESRIWYIFIQMVLALRYLHKDKGIVHRDLSPNNIMLGEADKVTITDFGLAKQKDKDNSQLKSAVGTLLYSCPEIVKNVPYTDKADIWAIGCILYQMCMLQPPFRSTNMLALAKQIVSAEYDPIPEELYSSRMRETVKSCITEDPSERPDIEGVAALMVDKLVLYIENMRDNERKLSRRLEKERKSQRQTTAAVNRHMAYYNQRSQRQQRQQEADGAQPQYMQRQSSEQYGANGGPMGGSSDAYHSQRGGGGSSFSESEASINGHSGRGNSLAGIPVGRARRKLDMDSFPSAQQPMGAAGAGDMTNGSGGGLTGPWGNVGGGSTSGEELCALSDSDMRRMADNVFERQYRDGNNNNGVWTSEEDSSGDSRESSGNSTTLQALSHKEGLGEVIFKRPAPPSHPRNKDRSGRRTPRITEQLMLNLGSQTLRDSSSISSCDPSPGSIPRFFPSPSSGGPLRRVSPLGAHLVDLKRSTSSPQLVEGRRAASGGKSRPNSSGTGTLSISPRKVRQITDPILQLLTIAHKIIYVEQLPPTVKPNPRRRMVIRFKRALFDTRSTSAQLKAELKKIQDSSPEIITDSSTLPLDAGGEITSNGVVVGGHRSQHHRHRHHGGGGVGSAGRALSRQTSLDHEGIHEESLSCTTYETMGKIIEEILTETGYYDSLSRIDPSHQLPLAPITRNR